MAIFHIYIINIVELHDVFSVEELLYAEALGLGK
jgi:hypothetical protein